MGQINIPATGPVYLDTDALIYSVEHIEPFATLIHSLWQAAHAGPFMIISSELALLETLATPFRHGAAALAASERAWVLS